MSGMLSLKNENMIELHANYIVSKMLASDNCALVPSKHFCFSSYNPEALEVFIQDWEHLEIDPYMADGGSYRLRRYGEFKLDTVTLDLTYQPDATFYQSLKINLVNGGIDRKFASLSDHTVHNQFLRCLIITDFKELPFDITSLATSWKIGIHQIRIRAVPGQAGNPTPEGIHRDDEMFTVQHLIHRHNITGGENHFYGCKLYPTKNAEIKWMQKDFFDSYYFDRSVWHSVSPVNSEDGVNVGYRDIILLDFVPIPEIN